MKKRLYKITIILLCEIFFFAQSGLARIDFNESFSGDPIISPFSSSNTGSALFGDQYLPSTIYNNTTSGSDTEVVTVESNNPDVLPLTIESVGDNYVLNLPVIGEDKSVTLMPVTVPKTSVTVDGNLLTISSLEIEGCTITNLSMDLSQENSIIQSGHFELEDGTTITIGQLDDGGYGITSYQLSGDMQEEADAEINRIKEVLSTTEDSDGNLYYQKGDSEEKFRLAYLKYQRDLLTGVISPGETQGGFQYQIQHNSGVYQINSSVFSYLVSSGLAEYSENQTENSLKVTPILEDTIIPSDNQQYLTFVENRDYKTFLYLLKNNLMDENGNIDISIQRSNGENLDVTLPFNFFIFETGSYTPAVFETLDNNTIQNGIDSGQEATIGNTNLLEEDLNYFERIQSIYNYFLNREGSDENSDNTLTGENSSTEFLGTITNSFSDDHYPAFDLNPIQEIFMDILGKISRSSFDPTSVVLGELSVGSNGLIYSVYEGAESTIKRWEENNGINFKDKINEVLLDSYPQIYSKEGTSIIAQFENIMNQDYLSLEIDGNTIDIGEIIRGVCEESITNIRQKLENLNGYISSRNIVEANKILEEIHEEINSSLTKIKVIQNCSYYTGQLAYATGLAEKYSETKLLWVKPISRLANYTEAWSLFGQNFLNALNHFKNGDWERGFENYEIAIGNNYIDPETGVIPYIESEIDSLISSAARDAGISRALNFAAISLLSGLAGRAIGFGVRAASKFFNLTGKLTASAARGSLWARSAIRGIQGIKGLVRAGNYLDEATEAGISVGSHAMDLALAGIAKPGALIGRILSSNILRMGINSALVGTATAKSITNPDNPIWQFINNPVGYVLPSSARLGNFGDICEFIAIAVQAASGRGVNPVLAGRLADSFGSDAVSATVRTAAAIPARKNFRSLSDYLKALGLTSVPGLTVAVEDSVDSIREQFDSDIISVVENITDAAIQERVVNILLKAQDKWLTKDGEFDTKAVKIMLTYAKLSETYSEAGEIFDVIEYFADTKNINESIKALQSSNGNLRRGHLNELLVARWLEVNGYNGNVVEIENFSPLKEEIIRNGETEGATNELDMLAVLNPGTENEKRIIFEITSSGIENAEEMSRPHPFSKKLEHLEGRAKITNIPPVVYVVSLSNVTDEATRKEIIERYNDMWVTEWKAEKKEGDNPSIVQEFIFGDIDTKLLDWIKNVEIDFYNFLNI